MNDENNSIYKKYILSTYNNLYELLNNGKLLEDIINAVGLDKLLSDIRSIENELENLKYKVENQKLSKQAIQWSNSITYEEYEKEMQHIIDYIATKYEKEIIEYKELNNLNEGDTIDLLQFTKYLNEQIEKES